MITYLTTNINGRNLPDKYQKLNCKVIEIDKICLNSFLLSLSKIDTKFIKIIDSFDSLLSMNCGEFHKFPEQDEYFVKYIRSGNNFYKNNNFTINNGNSINDILEYIKDTENYMFFDLTCRMWKTMIIKKILKQIKSINVELGNLFPLWIDYNIFQLKNFSYQQNTCMCYWEHYVKPDLQYLDNLRQIIKNPKWQLVLNEFENFHKRYLNE